jgi:hypothetical protein
MHAMMEAAVGRRNTLSEGQVLMLNIHSSVEQQQ